MLDQDTRAAILRLRKENHGTRTIANALGVSRSAVKRVLKQSTECVPNIERPHKIDLDLEEILDLHAFCKGNMVRVHEELTANGIVIPYSTLTRFCRQYGIGVNPKKRSGRYHFDPGEEMQHDTSPHDVKIGSKIIRVQCASLILCYSRMIYAQVYPRFNRFYCKVFLTDALKYLGGAAEKCMLDNSTVIMAHGTGKNAVPAPEMKALSNRFNFKFIAHEVGDANRSGRVERPFHYIEHNFYVGRTFTDFDDLNEQFLLWCEKTNRKYRDHLRAAPIELYQLERPHLKALPIHVPEIYDLHQRIVDLQGNINLHTNRYSVPEDLIDKRLEIRESKNKVRIFLGHRLICEHKRQPEGAKAFMTLAEHKYKRKTQQELSSRPVPGEDMLRNVNETLSRFVELLKVKQGGRAVRPIKRLHRMFLEYPTDTLSESIKTALAYGLVDLERIEKMVLQRIAGEFFQLPLGVIDEEENKNVNKADEPEKKENNSEREISKITISQKEESEPKKPQDHQENKA